MSSNTNQNIILDIPKQIKQIVVRSRIQYPQFQIKQIPFIYQQNDIIIKVLYFSVDPLMKLWLSGAKTNFKKCQIGDVFNCFGLGKVIKNTKFKQNQVFQQGSYVFGNTGTAQYFILNQSKQREVTQLPTQLVEKFGASKFLYMINNALAAYSGVQFLLQKANENDTVVVSTAAGATGLLVCYLLLKKKINVIGLTSQLKIQTLRKIYPNMLKIVDYKDIRKLRQTLDCNKFIGYFDNVGQRQLDLMIQKIQQNGRISLCGGSSGYNNFKNIGLINYKLIQRKRLFIKGINFTELFNQAYQIFQQFTGCQLYVEYINLQQFNDKFNEILKSGGSTVGKILVKL